VQVRFSRRAPLGDPSVYSVDGTEIALRAETARHIMFSEIWFKEIWFKEIWCKEIWCSEMWCSEAGLRQRVTCRERDPVERMLRYSFGPLLAIGEKDPTASGREIRTVALIGRRIQGSRRSSTA